jgi:hypothetical protein
MLAEELESRRRLALLEQALGALELIDAALGCRPGGGYGD